MRVFEVIHFIQKYKDRNLINVLPLISISFLFCSFLFFYSSKEINLITIMLSFISGLIISYQSIKVLIEHRKNKILKFLEKLKNHTESKNDYKCLNYLLLDENVLNFKNEIISIFKESNVDFQKVCFNGRKLIGR